MGVSTIYHSSEQSMALFTGHTNRHKHFHNLPGRMRYLGKTQKARKLMRHVVQVFAQTVDKGSCEKERDRRHSGWKEGCSALFCCTQWHFRSCQNCQCFLLQHTYPISSSVWSCSLDGFVWIYSIQVLRSIFLVLLLLRSQISTGPLWKNSKGMIYKKHYIQYSALSYVIPSPVFHNFCKCLISLEPEIRAFGVWLTCNRSHQCPIQGRRSRKCSLKRLCEPGSPLGPPHTSHLEKSHSLPCRCSTFPVNFTFFRFRSCPYIIQSYVHGIGSPIQQIMG